MYGLEAISFHNGWAMALAGALIVFAGLVVLSTVIAQLHKILTFWEKRHIKVEQKHQIPTEAEPEEESALPSSTQFPSDINEIARLYKPLIEELGETFFLADLYEIAKNNDFPHPHITLTAFRESEILIPHGDGVFTWNQPDDNEDNKKE